MLNPKPPPLAALAAAVSAAAVALGISRATAQQHGRRYYVAYTAPSGATIHTQASPCPRQALYRFEGAAISDLTNPTQPRHAPPRPHHRTKAMH